MYKKHIDAEGKYIIRDADSAHIPVSIENKDYAIFLKWLADNNKTIDDVLVANLETNEQKKSKEMPTLSEKVDAIFEALANSNNLKLDKVKAKIAETEAKYPAE